VADRAERLIASAARSHDELDVSPHFRVDANTCPELSVSDVSGRILLLGWPAVRAMLGRSMSRGVKGAIEFAQQRRINEAMAARSLLSSLAA
jgi:hypothetical protein